MMSKSACILLGLVLALGPAGAAAQVTKNIPTITWAAPAAITYGTALSATQLDATTSISGIFVYTPAVGAIPPAGTDTLSVTFTPLDITDYSSATATVSLVVNMATPAITWAQPAAITAGTALSATQLDAQSTVAGTFVYSPISGTYPAAGLQILSTTFTPTDTSDYNTATKMVPLVVSSTTSSTGVVGSIPMFIGTSSLGDSVITQAGGNIGIGANPPTFAKLQIGPFDTNSGDYLAASNGWDTAIRYYSQNGWGYISNNYDYGFVNNTYKDNPAAKASSIGLYSSTDDSFPAITFNAATTSGAVMNSLMSILDNGNVGIGTQRPQYPLDVAGVIRSSGGILFPDGKTQTVTFDPSQPLAIGSGGYNLSSTSSNGSTSVYNKIVNYATGYFWQINSNSGYGTMASLLPMGSTSYQQGGQLNLYNNAPGSSTQQAVTVQISGGTNGTTFFNSGGDVGIGTPSPGRLLDVSMNNANTATGNMNIEQLGSGDAWTNYSIVSSSGPSPSYALGITNAGNFALGYNASGPAGLATFPRLTVLPSGNVGIGTTAPGAKLEVDGNIKLTAGSGASITFQDGSVQSVAYTGVLPGGDYADSVDVTGDRAKYEAGELLVIDPNHPGKFLKSTEPYSTSVAGIFSTKPGTVGRRQTGPKNPDEVPMAMVGIVPTKVTAENGPIHPGDLLVTSSTLGYAMKGTDRSRMLGAVVGKALGSLDSGTGVIEVVVTLQ